MNYGVLTICMENPEIPGRIQLERFNPVKIVRKKSNTFRGITFIPFLPKRPKFLFGLPVPGFKSRESGKITGIL